MTTIPNHICLYLFSIFSMIVVQSQNNTVYRRQLLLDNWYEGAYSMPRPSSSQAIGYDSSNELIWLLGEGLYQGIYSRQLMSFDVNQWTSSNAFVYYGENVLSDDVWGVGDFYTQINDVLYMINTDGTAFSTFVLSTQEFSSPWNNIAFPISMNLGSLTHIYDYLIVSGGYNAPSSLSEVQIFNISSNSWLVNVPSMIRGRAQHTSVVHSNYLYMIGGYNMIERALIYIEKLYVGDMNNIQNENFFEIAGLQLSTDKYSLRAVCHGSNIFVIGGYIRVISTSGQQFVDIIDTATDTVTSDSILNTKVGKPAVIIVNERLYVFGGGNFDSGQPTISTWQYSTVPTDNPTMHPTQSPTTCEENGLIKHVHWNDLHNTLPSYQYSQEINTNNIGINIEIITDYVGYSYDTHEQTVGTTYIFDFEQFSTFTDKIQFPGSCSNRLKSSYVNKQWNEYWEYSENPSYVNQLGTIDYLAYGPLPQQWTLTAETNCTSIRYYGQFSWSELMKCSDYEGNKLISIVMDDNWINMTGKFYLSMVSPIDNMQDIGVFYMHNLIVAKPFKIAVAKSMHVLNNIGLTIFSITIYSANRIFEDHINNNGGYEVILSSQILTVHFLKLTNPNLLTFPSQYNSWIIAPMNKNNSFNNGNCYIDSNNFCVQFWSIRINELNCPISFDGTFSIQWNATCNDVINNSVSECNSYLSNHGNKVTLTTDLRYADKFECNDIYVDIPAFNAVMEFYKTDLFLQIQNNSYRSEYDRIYAQIAVNNLSESFRITLVNVWICSSIDGNILHIDENNALNSGCFDVSQINSDTFDIVILNEQTLLHNPIIYNTSQYNDMVTFSFLAPKW
eukprot:377486_1